VECELRGVGRAFLGCALCGAIAVPVDDAASPDFARRIGAQVRTKLVLCPRSGVGFRWIATERVRPSIRRSFYPRRRALSAAFSSLRNSAFRHARNRFHVGTTAEPKGVVLTHANVVGNLVPIETEIKKYLKYERLVHPIRFLNLLR